MTEINLFKLYNQYNGDISEETNTLSRLDDKTIVKVLKDNWKIVRDRANSKIGKVKCSVIYTKVLLFSSTRQRTTDEFEGFYSVTKDSTKYYTTFTGLSKFLISKGWNPTFKVSEVGRNSK